MDGLVVLLGALVLLATLIWLAITGAAKLIQRIERSYPDDALPPLRVRFIRRGCDGDYRKYLQWRRSRARVHAVVALRAYRSARASLATMDAQAEPQS